MFIRFSRDFDYKEIKELVLTCFGVRDDAMQNIDGRYLVAMVDGKIIAMSGLTWSDDFIAYEIDWTCTHPDYRGMGFMTELFKRITVMTDEDIYCSCWHLADKETANLAGLMSYFSFEEVVTNRVTYNVNHNCICRGACVFKDTQNCTCSEDLFIRHARENVTLTQVKQRRC